MTITANRFVDYSLDRTQLYFSVFDKNRKEERISIGGIDDIDNYAEQIIATVQRYDSE